MKYNKTKRNLTADVVAGFSGSILASRYDSPKPTPDFHHELWDLCCSNSRLVAAAAPRGHAKSTAVTHAFVLANLLFRKKRFVIIVAYTERQAIQFLNDIKLELKENGDLIELFGVKHFVKEAETEIVVRLEGSHEFKIMAKGAGQALRGAKWRGARPDLIIGDDLEDDEQVLTQDRREKFRDWFYGALVPCLSDDGEIRIVGTIMHMDSLLERLLNDPEWNSKRYRAHNEDFTDILWPEKFPKRRLESIRNSYITAGTPEKYAQEYLNYPIDETLSFFRPEDFREMDPEETPRPKIFYATGDLAISQKERADFSVFAVFSVDDRKRILIEDIRRGRWDSKDIIDEMFSIQSRYHPDIFLLESGQIEKSIGPFLNDEMIRRDTFINIDTIVPTKDKQSRARSIQGRMKAGTVFFKKDASWYFDLEQEMRRFPRDIHDDQVDAIAYIGLLLDKVYEANTPRELSEMEWEEEWEDTMNLYDDGRSVICGY